MADLIIKPATGASNSLLIKDQAGGAVITTGTSGGVAYGAGVSSLTYGYLAFGGSPQVNVIQKYAFAADGNATDVGDMPRTALYVAGTQY